MLPDMNKLRQLFKVYCREFKIVIHDPGIIIFFLFLPLAYPVIYSLIYNPELVREVAVVVVDNDRSSISRQLVRNFDATHIGSITLYPGSVGKGLCCRYG